MIKVVLLLLFSAQVFGYSTCEVNFVKLMNGDLPADIAKNPMMNMWDERFDPEYLLRKMREMSSKEKKALLLEMKKLVAKENAYNNNLSFLLSKIHEEDLVPFSFLKKNFVGGQFDNAKFFYSRARKEFSSTLDIDPAKKEMVEKFLAEADLETFYAKEYRNILLRSNLSSDDLDFVINRGLNLRQSQQELEQFARYVEYLDNVKPFKLRKGLEHIDDIYIYEVGRNLNPLLKPHQKFLQQNRKLQEFELRRVQEIERSLKLQQNTATVQEIDEAIKTKGLKLKIQEKLRFRKKIDDQALPASLRQRAVSQARHEKSILRKLWNGCNKGSSQKIAGARKKFSRFKFALTLGVNPAFYLYSNWDKKDEDQFFWEKMGYEVAMGVFYTFVGNKLITNTNSSFWRKYFEGYIKFGAISAVDAFSYETLFGKKSFVRYLQKIYKGDLPESQVEQEYQELVNSPDFEKNMQELISFLEEKSKDENTKNFLDRYLNLSASSSLDDELRITQEDLETEEAREMVMELLAERIYLQNMGNMAFFQTGRTDLDRFAFYRARNTVWDVKGTLVNLAIFELMCREPFGTVGSWGAILAIVMGDRYLDGSLSYSLRREAINQ